MCLGKQGMPAACVEAAQVCVVLNRPFAVIMCAAHLRASNTAGQIDKTTAYIKQSFGQWKDC